MSDDTGFKKVGNKVFSLVSGKTVATVNEHGEILMAKGMSGYRQSVEKFLAAPAQEQTEIPGAEKIDAADVTAPLPEAVPDTVTAPEADPENHPETWVQRMAARDRRETTSPEDMTDAEYRIYQIPDSKLPDFSPVSGTATPGFISFCRKNELTPDEVTALIRRCEKRCADV